MKNNQIDPSSSIHPDVVLGTFNKIGKNVVIDIIGNSTVGRVSLGDNNIINDNTRIIVSGHLNIGDWNVFHNNMLVLADDFIKVGHNCWFGQNTILDGAGGLEIGNGVRVGMYSQIWTHVASGEQIEGCTFFSKRKTVINDDVWLVGSCYVSSGLNLGKRTTVLINSVVTKDTLENKCYAGNPAKLLDKVQVYQPKTLEQKFSMIENWLKDFVSLNNDTYKIETLIDDIIIYNIEKNEKVIFTKSEKQITDNSTSVFSLFYKTFNKTNLFTEREVYKYLYNNKARFIPK